jgi:four helix bundle protein
MDKKPAKSFEDLLVWQKAHRFVLDVYEYTSSFPKAETFGLTSQFRRAAISISANIAEGFKKWGEKDKVRFLNMAQGSLEECRYYLILARDLGYGNNGKMEENLAEISKLLESYSGTIRTSIKQRASNSQN